VVVSHAQKAEKTARHHQLQMGIPVAVQRKIQFHETLHPVMPKHKEKLFSDSSLCRTFTSTLP